MHARLPAALFLLVFALPALAQEPDHIYHLAIGDPARANREVTVGLDTVVDTATGDALSVPQLAARLADTRLLLIGESHTSIEFHRVQLRVIRALHDAGRHVLIGLEMYPYTEQKWLDSWNDGALTEDGFVKLSRWYENWGYNWLYYRDIFIYARDRGIPMHAVNAPREVVSAVRKKGFQNLTPEEAAHIPADIDVTSADHMTFFKASFSEADALHGGMNDEAWKAMLGAQATWDATMGFNAVQALKKADDPKAIMVVLVGSGHVAYGVGIERQSRKWFDGRITTVVPVPVSDDDGKPVEKVQATYANFVWGIPGESASLYPSLGVSTRAGDGGRRQVLQVEKDGAGARAGFQVNDVIVSMDGHPVPDRETLNALLAHKHWADQASFVVLRDGKEQTLVVSFRRDLPTPPPPPAPPAKPGARDGKGTPKNPTR